MINFFESPFKYSPTRVLCASKVTCLASLSRFEFFLFNSIFCVLSLILEAFCFTFLSILVLSAPATTVLQPSYLKGLELLSFASKLIADPQRAVPLATWLAYVYFVFFSHALLPGPDVTQLDPATWTEVIGLSLNFGFVSPVLQLPFSPVLHPVSGKERRQSK